MLVSVWICVALLPTQCSLICGLTTLKTKKTPRIPRKSEKRGSHRLRGEVCELHKFSTYVSCDLCRWLASAAQLEEDCGLSVSYGVSPYLGNKEGGMRLGRRAADCIIYSS